MPAAICCRGFAAKEDWDSPEFPVTNRNETRKNSPVNGDSWRNPLPLISSPKHHENQFHENPEPQRDWYTVAEVAQKLSRADFTVREWVRLGRIYASKRACGRGPTQEWIISTEEVERIQNEGLLPN